MALKGSKTEGNLKAAFAGESQANRRYLYFAAKADVEGFNDVAAVFRSTAEGETGHAHGTWITSRMWVIPPRVCRSAHVGQLKAAIAGETHEYTDMYPGMAKRRATRASVRLPTGSRRSPRPRDPTRTVPKALDTLGK